VAVLVAMPPHPVAEVAGMAELLAEAAVGAPRPLLARPPVLAATVAAAKSGSSNTKAHGYE
jgi:hypothetical protein